MRDTSYIITGALGKLIRKISAHGLYFYFSWIIACLIEVTGMYMYKLIK